MPRILRSVLAVVVGTVVSVGVVALGDGIVGRIWALPAGVDPQNMEQLRQAISSMPTMAFVALLAGWAAAGAAGAFVATRLAPGRTQLHGMIVTALLLLATIGNLIAIPHPIWMWPAAIVLIPAAGCGAARAASGRADVASVAT